jgi:polysaccharide export outer membrane protein
MASREASRGCISCTWRPNAEEMGEQFRSPECGPRHEHVQWAFSVSRFLIVYSVLIFSLTNVSAQQFGTSDTRPQSQATSGSVSANATDSQPVKGNPSELGPAVRIAPGDEIDITVFGLPELSQHVRVGSSGDVSLPLVGNVHLADLTSDEAQALIEGKLTDGHFVNNPQVSVYVKEYTAEGISLMGEVNRPGGYSALSSHRLVDLIQTAGGLTDKAGNTVTVTHRDDPTHPITLTLSDDAAKTVENNIELLPGDTIVVSKAGIVYVVGEVNRPGGFVIEGHTISASQVLAMAAGPTRLASLNRAQIVRRTPGGLKEIPLPLQKVLHANIPDPTLQADDIIFVPVNNVKSAMGTGSLNITSLLLSMAIYRIP